ncbi:pyridoxal 5'-phosphate synthase glutaminase subunit PdxT [Nakamurella sp. YIM 132087]|uniref:Pyridoxal 5'-phosphate synthase subunit PdxT n=1 Tax=Nakamurella alba TaxID=2665158 RepID=A0A7K1FSJ5_9ACTN|nr:pyridoxal 5'-phosphate synthase glutaminase subunit PdxT [Nakamurella alba]MTD16369.1 pyridoxal 5'-phosphate synthase glutaminase subunit PdxT [Nakamurella alba]
MSPTIGVLALQGDVAEHLIALAELDATARPVRRASDLDGLDGIVLPGGESTTMSRLLDVFELREPLQQRLHEGLPAYGSCAGMILLATEVLDGRPDQRSFGVLDITVRRNAFGRQVDSFETDLEFTGLPGEQTPVRAVFIRAPWVERTGADVEVLAAVGEHPVAVRQGRTLATSFHPEVTGDRRVHGLFLEMVRAG